MPIAEDDDLVVPQRTVLMTPVPGADLPKEITSMKIAADSVEPVATDLKFTDPRAMLTHVSGAEWSVDYFSQVLTTDSAVTGLATSASGVHQQYRKIKGLVIRVTSPLTYQQDESTRTEKLSGTALLYAKLIPNDSDMFMANVGLQSAGVFRIVSSRKSSVHREAVYEIEYVLDSADPAYALALERKVVQQLVYRQDFLENGQFPFIATKDHEALLQLAESCHSTFGWWMDTFLNQEYSLFLLPGQTEGIYDTFLSRFIHTGFDVSRSWRLINADERHVNRVLEGSATCLWHALRSCSWRPLLSGFTKWHLVARNQFQDAARLNGFYWTGLPYAVYPKDVRAGTAGLTENDIKPGAPISLNTERTDHFYGGVNTILGPQLGVSRATPRDIELTSYTTLDTDNKAPLRGAMGEEYYVLSRNFYEHNRIKDRSLLDPVERVVVDHLDRKKQDTVQLLALLQDTLTWTPLDQYYLVPILLQVAQTHIATHGKS